MRFARRTVFSLLHVQVNAVLVTRRLGVHSPGMRDTDDGIDMTESSFEQLISQYTRCICKAEEAVVRKHCFNLLPFVSEQMSVKNPFVPQATQTCMRMDDVDALPEDNCTQVWEERKEVR